jgi:hypothetical protein
MAVGFGLTASGVVVAGVIMAFGGLNAGLLWKLLSLPFVFGFGLIAQVMWNFGVSVRVYPVGLLRVGRGKVETYLWDELASVKVRYESMAAKGTRNASGGWEAVWFEGKIPSVRMGTTWVELKRADGETLKLTAIVEDFATLATRCQQESFARLWPAALDALAAGQPVGPGTWVADAAGLTLGKGRYAWEDVKKVDVAGRNVTKSAKATDLSAIENPQVLFALLDERVGNVVADVTPVAAIDESNAGET